MVLIKENKNTDLQVALALIEQFQAPCNVDIDTISDIDDDEVEKMLLKPDERDFKTRVWNNLNKDWIIEQKERKRKKKQL